MRQKGFTPVYLLIVILVIIVIAGGAFYLGKQTTSKSAPAPITTSQNTQPVSSSASFGEITSWKTYTNTVYNYQFKYPEGYKITDKVPNQSICILKNGDNTCKLIIAISPLNEYQLVDNAGGFIFYFDIKQKEWLHYKTNTASQFIPKRIQSLTESYTYKTGDVKCSQEYILIPTSSYSNIAEIVNNKCKDDDGNFLPGYNDFSTDQILSTFKFIDQGGSNETVSWKTYTNKEMGLFFKYPSTWYFVDESSSQAPFIRIQNYSPQALGRGYSPQLDKGKTFIVIMKRSLGATVAELKSNLILEDEQSTENLGPRIVSNEKEETINGYSVYYRKVSLGNNSPDPYAYILNGKGDVAQFSIGLDTASGINTFDQILSTFKFIP